MENNYERLESSCKGRMVRLDDPLFVQGGMIEGDLGKELYLDTITLGAFLPLREFRCDGTPWGSPWRQPEHWGSGNL